METQANEVSGRARSALNACKHGGCSKQVIVKGERPEDFAALVEWWESHYEAEECRPFLEAAVLDEWLLHRAQRNYLAVEARLAETDAHEWSGEQMHRLQLMQRYKTAAERSFARSAGAVERFRRTRVYEKLAQDRAEVQKEERERQRREDEEEMRPKGPTVVQRKLALPPVVPVPVLTQWVTVTQDGENTVTTLKPSNEELLAQAEAMEEKPVRVCRKMTFRPWLATEYVWVKSLGQTKCPEQVMTFSEWLKALQREKETPGGHIGPVEKDPSWIEDWLKEEDDGKNAKQGAEAGGEKNDGDGGRTKSDRGAVGGGSDPEWTDSDGADPGKHSIAQQRGEDGSGTGPRVPAAELS